MHEIPTRTRCQARGRQELAVCHIIKPVLLGLTNWPRQGVSYLLYVYDTSRGRATCNMAIGDAGSVGCLGTDTREGRCLQIGKTGTDTGGKIILWLGMHGVARPQLQIGRPWAPMLQQNRLTHVQNHAQTLYGLSGRHLSALHRAGHIWMWLYLHIF